MMYEAKQLVQSIINKLLQRTDVIEKYNSTPIDDLTQGMASQHFNRNFKIT